MPRIIYTPEQIILKLREAEILIVEGTPIIPLPGTVFQRCFPQEHDLYAR